MQSIYQEASTSARRCLTTGMRHMSVSAPRSRGPSSASVVKDPRQGGSSAPPRQTPTPTIPTTHYRVTLRRSAIGLPSKTKRVLETLGLHKRLQSIILPQSPDIAGKILAVKELVHVDNVRRFVEAEREARQAQLDRLVAQEGGDAAALGLDEWTNAAMLEDELYADPRDPDAVWLNANAEVVDWGRERRRAPRGYRVVGSLTNPERDALAKQREENVARARDVAQTVPGMVATEPLQ